MIEEDFINQQLEMLLGGFNIDQIKDNVYRYVFNSGIPNIVINTLINKCMGIYAEIIIRYNKS